MSLLLAPIAVAAQNFEDSGRRFEIEPCVSSAMTPSLAVSALCLSTRSLLLEASVAEALGRSGAEALSAAAAASLAEIQFQLPRHDPVYLDVKWAPNGLPPP